MNWSPLITAIYHDKPGVLYENPPPPSNYCEDDLESIFFIYPRPQSVKNVNFLRVDYSLFPESLIGRQIGEKEPPAVTIREEKSFAEVLVNKTRAVEKEISNSEASKEDSVNNAALLKRIKQEILEPGECTVYLEKKKEKIKKEKRKKAPVSKSPVPISKSYSVSGSDSDCNEKRRSKSSSHHKKSRSKKSSRHRSAEFSVKREIFSDSDGENLNSAFAKKAEISVKEEVLSDRDEYRIEKIKSSKSSKKKYETKSHADPRKYESRSRDDGRSHDSWNYEDSRNRFDDSLSPDDRRRRGNSRSPDDRRRCGNSRSPDDRWRRDNSRSPDGRRRRGNSRSPDDRRRRGNSRSPDDRRKRDDSRYQFDYSRSPDDYRKPGDLRNNRSDNSSEDSRNRYYDDSNSSSRNFRSHMKREVKQEIKQEPGCASSQGFQGTNDFYCDICKLVLNSQTTFDTHMAGKRHKKMQRQLSEQEVAKSSVLEITESRKPSRSLPGPAPGVDQKELHNEVSKIQETCEDEKLLIAGLEFVREIRGAEDTKFFCDLCSAQCVANSIIKHLIGFKHQKNCMKEYCYRYYHYIRDLEKRDRRVDCEIQKRLGNVIKCQGRGRIRVFQEVKKNRRSPEPFNPYQPSTSRQTLVPDVQGKKADEPKVTDEECLSRDYSDFFCKVCNSHMNNYSMWESHARGKKHAKNKKKAEEGEVATSNYIEAPPGTISHLEDLISEQCSLNDLIVGLKFIRENQGENGDLYNCFLCGSVCPTIDIIEHLRHRKHKAKYLEKMHSDGYLNGITEINILPLGESAREPLIDMECEKFMLEFGRGKPDICIAKKTF